MGGNTIPNEKIIPITLIIDGAWHCIPAPDNVTCQTKDNKTTLTLRPTNNLPITWQMRKQ